MYWVFGKRDIRNSSSVVYLRQAEGTNFQKVFKLLELIPTLNDGRTIDKLCAILEPDYEWLADELRAEIASDRGQLKLDDYVVQEAASLVYRQFGGSRRLSQREKKDIEMLVASRTQCAKEVLVAFTKYRYYTHTCNNFRLF